jgi:hypothetical protein
MDSEAMRRVLETTESQLIAVEAEQARLAKEADALRRVRSGLVELLNLSGDSTIARTTGPAVLKPNRARPGFPRGANAVREVLASRPDEPFTVAEVVDELVSRGWGEPSSRLTDSTRTNLGRAEAKFSQVVRVGPGRFMYRSADDPLTFESVDGPTDSLATTSLGAETDDATRQLDS